MAEDDKKQTTAVTAPTTPVISTQPTSYDETGALGSPRRQSDAYNNNSNNNNNNENDVVNGNANDEADVENAKDPEKTVGKDEGDFHVFRILKELNLNSYATKKTVAQAILDLALLAANASQLKYILSVGEKHEFYSLILWLVVTSIILQVVQAIICIILVLILDINKVDEQRSADIVNNICLCVVVLIVVVNVIISGFDMKGGDEIQSIR